jgi:hypothetical protein
MVGQASDKCFGAAAESMKELQALVGRLAGALVMSPGDPTLTQAKVVAGRCADRLRAGLKNRPVASAPRGGVGHQPWAGIVGSTVGPVRPPLRPSSTAVESAGAILDRMLAKGQSGVQA